MSDLERSWRVGRPRDLAQEGQGHRAFSPGGELGHGGAHESDVPSPDGTRRRKRTRFHAARHGNAICFYGVFELNFYQISMV